MPGTINSDVPGAITVQTMMEAGPLPCANGDLSDEAEKEPPVVACKECKAESKNARACGGCWQVWYCSRAHQVNGWGKHKRECRPWKVAKDQILGRYMIATRDIKAGELLLEDPPIMMGPKQITEPVCLACYRPVNGDYTCPKCGFPMCEEACSEADSHLPECKAVQDSGANVRVSVFGESNCMYECITPLRILTLKNTDHDTWNKIIRLESHADKRDSTEVAAITERTVVDIIQDRLQLEEEFDADLIQQILGIIDVNAFEIRLPDSSIMGVFGNGALIEHSCLPNTHRTFDADLNLVIRAAFDIKRGQHLQSCYTDSLSTTAARQEHLLTSKFFTCTCPRCIDPTELGTYLSAMLCPDCSRSKGKGGKKPKSPDSGSSSTEGSKVEIGVVLPKEPLSPSSPWICSTCDAPLDSDYVTRMTAVATEEAEELESATPNIKACEAYLEKWGTIFHQNHANFINVKYALLHLYGSESGYSLEEMTPLQLLRKENLAREILKIADALVQGISRLRGSVLYELYQTLFYKTCSMFQSGIVSNTMAKTMAQESYDSLLECARILNYEPPVQPEGQLGLEAKDELRQMIRWMKEEGWKG